MTQAEAETTGKNEYQNYIKGLSREELIKLTTEYNYADAQTCKKYNIQTSELIDWLLS